MSTKGAVGESFFHVRLIIVLAMVGAVAGFIAGNRIEWSRLGSAQMSVVHQFEIGLVLMKLKTCAITKAPHWITKRCNTYSDMNAAPAARQYLMPRVRLAMVFWPAGTAVGLSLLGVLGLALKSSRFRKLDEHAPRDYFKSKRMAELFEWALLGLLLSAGALGWLLKNRTVLLALAAPAIALIIWKPWHQRRKLKHVRGSKIEDAEDVERLIKKRFKGRLGGLEIGGVPIPRDFEVLNFLIAGAPGTGKSTAIAPMIATMRARGDRVFCADARGDYLRRFWREGDLILNPLDKRSVSWSPLAEIHDDSDAAAIARSLIPDSEGQDASWHRFAQLLLEGVLIHAKNQDLRNADVARLMLVAPVAELRERLAGAPAAGLLPEHSDSQMFHSIRGTAAPYVRALIWLAPGAGAESFSLRAWARDEKQTAACWWNYQDSQISGLRTLVATQLDLLLLGVLEQPDSRDRRAWLVIDELAALGRVATLEEFLARARKSGGAGLLGVQSLVQLRRLYAEHGASAIISCCSNLLALALGDSESQEYMSKLLGEQEQSVITRSASRSDASSQQTVQRTLRAERVLLPSEMAPGQLKSRTGFLCLPEVPIAPVRLEIYQFEDVASRFEPREVPAVAEPAPGEATPPAPDDAPESQPQAAAASGDATLASARELPPLAPDALIDTLDARRRESWAAVQQKDADDAGA